jgi:hypothetical protein
MQIHIQNNNKLLNDFIGQNNHFISQIEKASVIVRRLYVIPIKIITILLAIILIAILLIPGYFYIVYWLKKFKESIILFQEIIPALPTSELLTIQNELRQSHLSENFSELSKQLEKTTILAPLNAAVKGCALEINSIQNLVDKQINSDLELFNSALNNASPIYFDIENQ